MECQICNKPLTSNRELGSHLLTEHQKSPVIYFDEYPNATKFCSKCKEELPIKIFFVDKTNFFGHRAQCVNCMRPKGKRRACPICDRIFQWSAVITHMKKEHGIPPVHGYQKYLKEKYCNTCKKIKPLDEFSRLQDDDHVYFSLCRSCNMDRNIERIAKSQDFQLPQLLIIRLAFGDRCFLCGLSHNDSMDKLGEPLHIDHMKPHVHGGKLSLGNAAVLCKTCNLKKGTKYLNEFLLSHYEDQSKVSEEQDRLEAIQRWADSELQRLIVWHTHQGRYRLKSNKALNAD